MFSSFSGNSTRLLCNLIGDKSALFSFFTTSLYVFEFLQVFHHVYMGTKKKKKSVEEILLAKSIAAKLKELRKEHSLTQEDMEEYGIHVRQYQRLESGKQTPTIPTLIELAKIFNVKVIDFLR